VGIERWVLKGRYCKVNIEKSVVPSVCWLILHSLRYSALHGNVLHSIYVRSNRSAVACGSR